MVSKIPTIYTDKFGSIDTEINNDFEMLEMTLEGVKFVSDNYDNFTPLEFDKLPSRFTLNGSKELTGCSLLCEIPVVAVQNEKEISITLLVAISLGKEEEHTVLCHFSFIIESKLIEIGMMQDFESAFTIMRHTLLSGAHLKCCYNCLYADYSVAGSAMFGQCFAFKT